MQRFCLFHRYCFIARQLLLFEGVLSLDKWLMPLCSFGAKPGALSCIIVFACLSSQTNNQRPNINNQQPTISGHDICYLRFWWKCCVRCDLLYLIPFRQTLRHFLGFGLRWSPCIVVSVAVYTLFTVAVPFCFGGLALIFVSMPCCRLPYLFI